MEKHVVGKSRTTPRKAIIVPPLATFEDFEAFFAPSPEVSRANAELAFICIATAYPDMIGFTANNNRDVRTWAEILTEQKLNAKDKNFLAAFYHFDKLADDYAVKQNVAN